MANAVIICNGEFPKKEYPLYLLKSADYIICCDGAAATYLKRCQKIFGQERRPDAVIGDLDSLSSAIQKKVADILIKEDEQDFNDLNKAFRYVLKTYKDIDTIHILGASGMREDHTIGNLSYLMEYKKEQAGLKKKVLLEGIDINPNLNIDMVSDWSTAFAISDSVSFYAGEGREISLFSTDNSLNIKSEGLKWKTDNVVFDNWWKATLNIADRDEVSLKLNHPSAVLIIID